MQLLESQLTNIADDNAKLKAEVTDLEGRSRRCNVRLIGVPETVEGTKPTIFFSNLLMDILGKDVLPSPSELDRAHHALRPKPAEGDKPRAAFICFHKFQTKDMVIRAARNKRDYLKYYGKSVPLYDDYCPKVMCQLFTLKPSLLYSGLTGLATERGGASFQ